MKPTKDDLENVYQLFHKTSQAIFPIQWNTEIDLGEVKTGVIKGFGYYNNVMDSFDDIIHVTT